MLQMNVSFADIPDSSLAAARQTAPPVSRRGRTAEALLQVAFRR
jgi:hypothetical protein